MQQQRPFHSTNFGTVAIGTAQTATLDVTNAGGKAGQVRYTTLIGIGDGYFSVSTDQLTVAGNTTAGLEVTFAPTVVGLYEVVLQLDFGGDDVFETKLMAESIAPRRARSMASPAAS